jgi:(2Fe-2S) ferredoxin
VPVPEIQILVCVNDRGEDAARPSCGQRGSLDLYQRLKDRVKDLGLRDRVLVTRTGCLRHCSRGTTVVVWPAHHWYGGVAVEDAEELLDAALHGRCVERLLMPPGPWE